MPVKSNSVLIIGAGIGGIKAACDLSELGFNVHLVESAPNIGGKLQQHDRWFPTDDCTMCQSLPYLNVQGAQERCLRRVLAFPGVTIHAYSELESLDGKWGSFKATLKAKSRLIKPELCNECGRCAEVCPVEVKDRFQGGLAVRKAAYTLYPGAFPNTYPIDAEACTKCGECVKACPTGAVDLDLPDETVELKVGAVILAPGFEEFDPAQLPNYGYGRLGNVVTSTQFERITAGGGITPGRLTRPTDGEVPQSVAFLTCVGSRDTERPYCSYACCMYTLKEAIVAKELHPDMEIYVFYMDMRAFGKEWWKYYQKAQSLGVKFVRCRIASVERDSGDNLKINYEAESGEYLSRVFGMVVLAAGQVQPASSRELAGIAGVETDDWGFCRTREFRPVQTDKAGVFAAGSFAGPADISATVAQAQAAALEAASLLWDLRKPAQEPPELRKPDSPKSAILVAGEGAGDLAERISAQCRPDYLEVLEVGCPDAALSAICTRVQELADVDRAVVVAPLSWSWEALLVQRLETLGLAANKVEVVDTRSTDLKAGARMAKAALSRLSYAAEAACEEAEIVPSALVLGGGVTAMTAAQALSALGFKVHLVNSGKEFGGQAEKIHTTESGENVDKYLAELLGQVEKDKNICKHTDSNLRTTAGSAGRFVSVIETPDGPVEIAHGAVIIATGASEYDFSGNGYPDGVIGQSELEDRLLRGKLAPSSVVMIQCVGTLNDERPYCSRTCCAKAVKNALALKEASPQTEIFILCKEVMTYGLHELAYKEARDKGVIFLRYEDERPPIVNRDSKEFKVRVRDPLLEEEVELPADLVVLSTGTVSAASEQLAKALGVQLDEFGFFKEANPKFRPVETDRAGVFVCGLAQGPQSMDEAITQAEAAACKAAAILARKALCSSSLTSTVANRWCVGCELCVTVCPVHARVIDMDKKKARVYGELCVACGACATICPSSAAKSTAANDRQILATIETMSCE
jgi:heterodisulfide reductase subunit A